MLGGELRLYVVLPCAYLRGEKPTARGLIHNMDTDMSEVNSPEGLHLQLPFPAPHVRQIDALQVLRAFAVLLVIWVHASQDLKISTGRELPSLGIFGVDLFFVLSGFILSWVVLRSGEQPGPRAAWRFLLRRLIRVMPIFWFFAIPNVLVLMHRHEFTLARYWPALLLVPPPHYPGLSLVVDYSWTMMFEIMFYTLLSLVQLFTVRRAVPTLIVVLAVLGSMDLWVSIQRAYLSFLFNPILVEFILGAAIALLLQRFGRRKSGGASLVLLGIAGAFVCQGLHSRETWSLGPAMLLADQGVWLRVGTWGLCAAVIVGGLVFWSPTPDGPIGRFAVLMGNASYSAYLGSGLVLLYLVGYLNRRLAGHRVSVLAEIALELAIATVIFAVGIAAYQWVEWPMLHKLQRVLVPKA
jgi:exopolysaccharide production protein ExoZ